MDDVLPGSLLVEVLSRVSEASDLARCSLVSRRLLESVRQLRAVRLVCSLDRFLKTRQGGTAFKEIVMQTLVDRQEVEWLNMEVDNRTQAWNHGEEEESRTDLWLTEPAFVEQWGGMVGASLKYLSVTDFGVQARARPSQVLTILSTLCRGLCKLELINLSLSRACTGIASLAHLTHLTLECVSMLDQDLVAVMGAVPALESLSLVGVSGLVEPAVEGSALLACCLVLTSTPETVIVRGPRLSELRLQFLCPGPGRLTIQAPALASLEVFTEKRPGAVFSVGSAAFLNTLLLISPDLTCISDFSGGAVSISNMVFEAPLLAFDDAGQYQGILVQPRVRLPVFAPRFPSLDTLFLGPGLWYAMETDAEVKKQVAGCWPTLRKLVLHVLLMSCASSQTSLDLLELLLAFLPALKTLEIYFHSQSNAHAKAALICSMEKRFRHLTLKSGTWKDLVWSDRLNSR